MRRFDFEWVKKLDKDDMVSAVRVEVLRQDRFGNYDSDYFVFSIGYKRNVDTFGLGVEGSYSLEFIDENSYKVFVDSHSDIFIHPMIFRNAIDMTDFLASEAEYPETYYTIIGMIMSKLYEVLSEVRNSEQ